MSHVPAQEDDDNDVVEELTRKIADYKRTRDLSPPALRPLLDVLAQEAERQLHALQRDPTNRSASPDADPLGPPGSAG